MLKNSNFFSFEFSQGEKQLKFKINTKIYPLESVYQAAYFFLDQVYIFLDGEPQKEIQVIMKFKKEVNEKNLEELAGEFYNELLNQLLRHKISQSNAKIREYIVSQALYNAVPNEVDELLKEVEEEDWQEDPLGIAKTWEEAQDEKENEK
jgi:His-Xaa-Ser system protein HxsD